VEVRGWILGSTWLAIAVIASMYLYVGKISWETDIAVGILVAIGLVLTMIIGFGLEYFQTIMEKERPSTKALAQMSTELTEMKSMVSELAKKVDAIQKELQE
jgi:apolipoprotein N-acyltransferase